MFGFIKRVFGGGAAPRVEGDPFGRERNTPPVATVAAVTAPPRSAPAVVLQRDEIIDARSRIGGYLFAARRPESAQVPDAQATVEVLAASQVAAFAERRLALIPLAHQDWARYDYRSLIGPNTAFLLPLPVDVSETAAWRVVVQAIRDAGARVAVVDAGATSDRALVIDHADLLVLDFSAYALPQFEQRIRTLKRQKPTLQLMVDHIGRWPEYRYCLARGVAYCLGPFTTAQDEESGTGEIGQSRLVLIEMLNHLRREGDLAELAELAKRDPGVVVKLVAMANSPLVGLAQPVTGIDQAIMILGRQQLYRWLSIGMFRTGSSSPRDEVLLELALARGRFLELIGQTRHGKAECDELFLLGLLSLLDCLLGVPMVTVVERIHLSPALKEVLLSSDGPLGRYLLLAIAVEKGRADQVARLAGAMGLALADIEAATAEALGWADEAVRLSA